jgi:hypothetical protein
MSNTQLEIDIAEYILTHELLKDLDVSLFEFIIEDLVLAELKRNVQEAFNLDSEIINLIINREFVIKLIENV